MSPAEREIWLAAMLQVLESIGDYREVADHLPDIDITIG